MADEPIQQLKRCAKCEALKPATTEYFNKKLTALTAQCRECRNAAKRAKWAGDSASINERRRAERDDDTRRLERERYRRDGGRKKASVEAWREANPDKRKEIDRRHYVKNAVRKRELAADWSARNADRRRDNMRRWYREKRRLDPAYRLRAAMSAYVYWCLKGGKEGRSVEAVLGYSMADLRFHLERQFLPGMTWSNYGEWHVDHIVPVASFSSVVRPIQVSAPVGR